MNKQMLEEYFLELDEALATAFPDSEPMSVIVVGGAFLVLTDRINRQTDDVDVIITDLEGLGETSLVYEREEKIMSTNLQTLAQAYEQLYAGEEFRIALGNFMNEFFLYNTHNRQALLDAPLVMPEAPTEDHLHWAAFCAGAAEYLAKRYRLQCPQWAYDPSYVLSSPWYMTGPFDNPVMRASLKKDAPEPWQRRNVFCSPNIFTNHHRSSREPKSQKALLRHRQAMLDKMSSEERSAYVAEYNARVPRWMRISA